jgi:hypothetical protein
MPTISSSDFQHEAEARRFLEIMRARLKEFSLSLHPDETRLIEFGRFAAANRKRLDAAFRQAIALARAA